VNVPLKATEAACAEGIDGEAPGATAQAIAASRMVPVLASRIRLIVKSSLRVVLCVPLYAFDSPAMIPQPAEYVNPVCREDTKKLDKRAPK
jgi:hypothetical protein